METDLQVVIPQGATWTRTITFLDPDEEVVDLTGYTAEMMFRETVESSGAPVISLTTADNSIVINGPVGTVTPIISKTLTAALIDGQVLYYDLFIFSPTGIATRLLTGIACVSGSVTR